MPISGRDFDDFKKNIKIFTTFLKKIWLFLVSFCEHTERRLGVKKNIEKFLKKSKIFLKKVLTKIFALW